MYLCKISADSVSRILTINLPLFDRHFLFSRDKNNLPFPSSVTLSSRFYGKTRRFVFVNHRYIFRFKEPSSGITLEKL
jgi:hypothetical protein